MEKAGYVGNEMPEDNTKSEKGWSNKEWHCDREVW